jgi:hypothetical protein
VTDIEVKHCLTAPFVDDPSKGPDPNGEILTDGEGRPKFTIKGRRAANKERDDLFAADNIEIAEHLVPTVPDYVKDWELDGLVGFVITEQTKEAILKKRFDALPKESEDQPEVTSDGKPDS